jgi:GNAT superfamily N-acetyltransferase
MSTTFPLSLRQARPEDGERLAEIARQAYGKYRGMLVEPPAPILLDYELVAADGSTWVADCGDDSLGMVTVEPDEPDLILRNLAVIPAWQGRGIGSMLTAWVEDLARSTGMRGVRLWTRCEMWDNIAFYERLQYVVTHYERGAETNRVFFYKCCGTTRGT